MSELTDRQAIDAINIVAELWLEEKGRTAYAVMQATYARAELKKVVLPPWAKGPAKETPELANLARATLTAIMEGSDPDARRWAREALRRVETYKVQVVDPLTLAIGGTFPDQPRAGVPRQEDRQVRRGILRGPAEGTGRPDQGRGHVLEGSRVRRGDAGYARATRISSFMALSRPSSVSGYMRPARQSRMILMEGVQPQCVSGTGFSHTQCS